MNKEFLKKCWQDKRLHSLLVLIIWIVVLSIMIGIVFIINALKGTNTHPDIKDSDSKIIVLSYYDKLDTLLLKDYNFTYLITKENEKIKFEGSKTNGVIEGYKESNAGIIKYRIKDQKVYQILMEEEIEITYLYEDIDASLLDLGYVIGILKQTSENDIIIKEEEKITTYDYNLTKGEEELEISVVENEDAIEKITINRNNEIYQLQYQV